MIFDLNWREKGERVLYNFEMGPAAPGENHSQLNVIAIRPGESYVRANK